MKSRNSKDKPVRPTHSQPTKPPRTEQLALIAATLALSSNERPEMLTYDAMELWIAAEKRKAHHSSYWDSFEHSVNPPKHEVLAKLAVNLARKITDEPRKLVDAAFAIWMEAGFKVDDHSTEGYLQVTSSEEYIHFSFADVHKAGEPISRDIFFKKLLPPSKRSRTYDLAKVGKAFIYHKLKSRFSKVPTELEFQEFYKKWNAGDLVAANRLAREFIDWYKKRTREARSAAGKKSAEKRLEKKALSHI